MTICYSTQLSEAVSNNRWAAEFHRPGYKFVAKNPNDWRKIGRCSKLCQYGLSIKMNETGRGVPIYRLNEIENCFLSENPTKYAPISPAVALDYELEKRDILFCRTNGNINYVGRTGLFLGGNRAVFASYLVRVRTDPSQLLPEYLTIYLCTKFGRRQIVRRAMPSNQVNVSAAELKRIDAFLATREFQQDIAQLVQDAYRQRNSGIVDYTEAQTLLESQLGLDKLTFQKVVACTARLSESMISGRIDADYFQPQYAAVRSLVQSYRGGYEPLLACCDSLRPNIEPSKSPKQEFDYIELSNINASIGTVEGSLVGRGAELPSRARRQVLAGDIIASAVVGSIDKAAVISDEQDGFIASTGFFHLRPRTVSSEYLLMAVRSKVVRLQFQQQATGGILSAVPDSRLKHVIVPKLPVAIQQKIGDLVAASHQAKRKSDELLEQAKTRVERFIEEAVKS